MLGVARGLDKAVKIKRGKKKREKKIILEAYISEIQLHNCSDISQVIFEPVWVFFSFEVNLKVLLWFSYTTNGTQSLVTVS